MNIFLASPGMDSADFNGVHRFHPCLQFDTALVIHVNEIRSGDEDSPTMMQTISIISQVMMNSDAL
jgi:hypothetical protein